MYYIFKANKPIDMSHYEEFLNSVIVDEFYFEAQSDTSGYIETALPISDILQTQVNLMSEDLGISISFLGTPFLDELAYHLINTVLVSKANGYLSLADACLLALLKQDKYVWEALKGYFEKVDNETMRNIISFVKHGCNALATSKALYLHRNTMNYRISRFMEITNLDLRNSEHVQLIYLYALLKENGNII